MCGIFGIISSERVNQEELVFLARHAEQRGRDSSGLFFWNSKNYTICRSNNSITGLLSKLDEKIDKFVIGHSRLITNGLSDNQPIYRDDVCVIHNGIVVNHDELWSDVKLSRQQEIDTEIIAAIAAEQLMNNDALELIVNKILNLCKGVVACAIAFPKLGKLCLFSNNGSLYYAKTKNACYFSSEAYPLIELLGEATQVRTVPVVLDIPTNESNPILKDGNYERSVNLIPSLATHGAEEGLLEYKRYKMQRCTKCILPETMPFIRFDELGVCNFCKNYKKRNRPKPIEELLTLVEPYRRTKGDECIVPFSGGRDSCFGLHLIVKELNLKPIAYTYDWGMVTDLGRRNISRMCASLGVENIIVADDISLKRRHIAKNLIAWLKAPHLGMVSMLTAGDKHFFRHVETVKKQTGISLNLWGVNPLEVTHFKAGFLGVPPDFEESKVYSSGLLKQMRYQLLRLRAMSQSLGYFNSSLWDTLSGEYYRSFSKKSDYYHIFDYWRWDETLIDETLIGQYDWETAPDTKTTWRIGDGTAAIYNYIYYTVAGFTEHDTFRSNQIREGDITRENALRLVEEENQPRYPNIKWYLESIGLDFKDVIEVINSIPKLCRE